MEEVTDSTPYEIKVYDSHIYLMATISIKTDKDGKVSAVDRGNWADSCDIGMSDELAKFVDGCVGKVEVNMKNISLILHDRRDYVRFMLEGLNATTKA